MPAQIMIIRFMQEVLIKFTNMFICITCERETTVRFLFIYHRNRYAKLLLHRRISAGPYHTSDHLDKIIHFNTHGSRYIIYLRGAPICRTGTERTDP
jgi:hypothetical protein